ncbi:hypothetical protein [Streptomyces atratus]|uniref:Uncharacterized protein n=1 Tax=Streptomyces atratus TaxID=1893 RepID=A0A1K2D3L3_STRAR|nr:hypothetical protein SAMN02787144_1012109 [Streptomyces atratus]
MIKPEAIPQYTGDLGQLEKDHASLKTDAGHIRDTGSSVHTHFQALSAYYKAPEAEQLFASTKPVQDRADGFADDLEKVASSLSDYATEIRPLVTKLAQLKTDATTFVNDNKDDDEWEYDGDKVEEHNKLRDDITATVAAFWAAERTCHNKITALFGGTQMVAGDGSERKDQYGFNADDLKNAKLPWGDPVEEKHHWYEVGHWVKSFVWDGLIVDGIWGTIKGLGTLVGFGGWDAMGQAWKGLAQLATGLVISAVPGASTLFWTLPDDKLPSWLRDSRTAMKETGKALVAWDEWGKNPGRAAGAVTFNVLTTVFTGGAGGAAAGAGKAGAVAKVLSVAGKAGKVIDPMTYIAKGAGAGLSKIGDITKGLKGITNIEIPRLPDDAISLPEGTIHLPDGTVHLPEGAAIPEGGVKLPDGNVKLPDGVPVLPEGTTKLPTHADVPVQYFDNEGNLLDEHGDIVQKADDAAVEPSPDVTHTDTPHTNSPVREPALVGVGAHTADVSAHVGDNAVHLGGDLGDTGRFGNDLPASHTGDHLPGGHTDDLGRGPSAGHEPSTGGHHGDGNGGHGGGHDGPGSHGHDGPSTGGDHVPDGPGSDLPGPPHGGDGGVPGGVVPDGPRGNLSDGSWAGENGLRLDREANAAADDFMRRSTEAEPRITESMQGIAGKVDNGKLIGLEYRLKGEDSLKRKLATDMLEDVGMDPARALGDIKDSIRYTMEVPSNSYTHGVQQAIDDLQAKGFENVTFKNTWDSTGYKGINSTWRDPISGQTFELQFHTADSFAAKMDGHVLYEKERLPGVSPDELAAIKAEQSELFGKVPVPHDAGAITIGGRSVDDVVSALGRDVDSTAHGVGSVGDDVGRLGDDAAHVGDDATHVGDDAADAGDDAADGARADDDGGPYTHGPNGGWSGAGWVHQPSDYAAGIYEQLRATPNHVDLPEMARNTGVDESVLREVKSHMIRSQHDVVVQPGDVRRGLFTPRDDIAAMWDGARKGTLSEAKIAEFKNLMTHEYVESQLMKSGLPYLHDQTGLWRLDEDGTYSRRSPKSLSAAGAHDLSPNPVRGGFGGAWQRLGLKHPKVTLADDLSNIDDLVKGIFQELRAKGLDLK